MNNIIIKITKDINNAPEIHNVLLEAFEPFRHLYTEGSFNATVVSTEDLVKRIDGNEYDVLIAICDNEIAGTASVKLEGEKNLYLASMAVKPAYHGKGIGKKILEEAEKIARQKNCESISLETYRYLSAAIKLY